MARLQQVFRCVFFFTHFKHGLLAPPYFATLLQCVQPRLGTEERGTGCRDRGFGGAQHFLRLQQALARGVRLFAKEVDMRLALGQRTRPWHAGLRWIEHPRAVLVEPLDYLPFVKLMRAATLILSDSGGVQEEAPSLDTPVLVLRETTERPEAMETGAIDLVGVTREGIAGAAIRLLADEDAYRRMAEARNPFGDGTAASQIVDIVEERLGARSPACEQHGEAR